MADNTVSDSDSSREERADEDPINWTVEFAFYYLMKFCKKKKKLRIKLSYTVHHLNRNKTNFKCEQVKKNSFLV